MERRLYFVFGDVLACALAGGGAGLLAFYALPDDWLAVFGMLGGMGLGMIAGMLIGLLLSPFFGAMEVMIPAALAGMVSGMWVGMMHTTISLSDAIGTGSGIGVLCLAFTYVRHVRLHGTVDPDDLDLEDKNNE
ncbi:MAG: hypothetical protein JKX97_00030 [Candidatus Lindowbacteria bacterium]|nr:hypothetical protein [Candidatus Lindowbacteria bacterium]